MSTARLFTILAIITFAGVIFACAAILVRPPRGQTTDKRSKRARTHDKRGTSAQTIDQRRREVELEDLRAAEADKPPYQPPTPGFPPTAGMAAISKLPGQDRLTRDPRTGMDAQDRAQTEPDTGPIPAVPDDHLSGGPPATTAMPAVGRPAVPGAPAVPPAEPPAPTEPPPASPARPRAGIPLDPPRLPGESRAERRLRLESLALERAAQDRRPPQSPQDGPQNG